MKHLHASRNAGASVAPASGEQRGRPTPTRDCLSKLGLDTSGNGCIIAMRIRINTHSEDDMAKVPNRVMLSVPNDVTRKARTKAISEGTSMSAVVTAFLRAWLDGELDAPQPKPEKEVKPKKKKK